MGKHYALTMPIILVASRSSQSGAKVMPDTAGTWLTCYEQEEPDPWEFSGAEIDLTAMVLNDTVELEVTKIIVPAGAYTLEASLTYNDAQAFPIKYLGVTKNIYGYRVRARQTAGGAARTFDMQFFESMRQ